MKLVAWMIGSSAVTLVAASAGWPQFRSEIALGMAGPLAIVCGSWVLIEWAYRRDPASVTAVLMAGFAAKMVLFGAYVAVMLKVLALRPMPFVLSFTSYFVGLYVFEAIGLMRLIAGGTRAVR
jgi:hypothetical protein